MSISWLNTAWNTEVGSPTRKAVLTVLADHADEDGYCWPRVRTICQRTELSDRAVRDAVKVLETEGFISVQEDYEPAGRQTSNVYRLEIPPVSPAGGRVRELQGPPARRAAPTRTTSEPSDGGTPSRRRSATSSGRAADESLPDDDDAPALGASPKRKTQAEADTVAADRGTSGRGLAVRLQRLLKANPDVSGQQQVVEIGILAKRLNVLHRETGVSREVQAKCVELYGANPGRYSTGDYKGWTGFLAALPKLEADAGKHVRADSGGSRFGGAYKDVVE